MCRIEFDAWIGRAARWLAAPLWLCFATIAMAQGWGPGGNFQFTSATYVAPERGNYEFYPYFSFSSANITVTRIGGALGGAQVDYTIDSDTNAPGVDMVVPLTGTLRFEDFQTSATFTVPIIDNAKILTSVTNVSTNNINNTNFVITNIVTYLTNQINRRVLLSLSNPQADDPVLAPVGLGFRTNAVLRVLDDDTGFNFTYSHEQVDENIPGFIRIAVNCPEPRSGPVSVNYKVISTYRDGANSFPLSAGSDYAKPDQDFTPVSGTLTIPRRDSSATFDVTILDDNLVEFNEDFQIILENPSGQWRAWATIESITNDLDSGTFIGSSIRNVTNDIDMAIGEVGSTIVTILFDSLIGVWYTNNSSGSATVATIANEQPAGAVDLTWNPDYVDWSIPPFNFNPGALGTVYGIVVQPDNMAVAVGDFTDMNTEHMNRIARLDTNGWLDASFQIGTGADDFIQAVALYGTNGPHPGKIVIGGGFTSYDAAQRYGIARLNANGSLDASFNPGTGANAPVRAVAVQPDGKVLLGGEFTAVNGQLRPGIARLNVDGSLDAGFNPGDGADGTVWAVGVVTNGGLPKIMIGGDFVSVNGEIRSGIARLNSDGSLDVTFNPGTGVNGSVYAISVQPDQRVLVGGAFTEIDLRSRNNIARLNADGTLDDNFDVGTGANDSVYALHLLPNGRILVGGAFNTFNDTRRLGVTRLYSHGPVDTEILDFAYNQYAGIIDRSNFVAAVSAETTGNVLIGGLFSRVGGGFTRVDWHPRENIARLVGNSTPGPGTIQFQLPRYRVNENAGLFSAALVRTNGAIGSLGQMLGPVTIGGSTSDGLALGGQDFGTNFSTFLFFDMWPTLWPEDTPVEPGWMVSDGATNSLVFVPALTIPIVDDSLQEGDETFQMHLAPPPFGVLLLGGAPSFFTSDLSAEGEVIPLGISLGRRSVEVTIVDNDVSAGAFAFSAPEYVVNENGGNAVVTVIRTNGSVGSVSIDYRTQDMTNGSPALAGSDYTARPLTTLTFGSGQTSRQITIPILDNLPVEPDESFLVLLSDPRGGATLSSLSNALVTIIDDDYKPGRLSFTQTNYTVSEAGVFATIGVKRTGGNLGTVSANFATVTNTAGLADFVQTNGVLTWADGDTSVRTFTVQVSNDSIVEPTENLRLILTNLVGALPGTYTNVPLTILEDDSYGTFQLSSAAYLADEVGGSTTVTIVRSGGSIGAVSVRLDTLPRPAGPGSATAGADYTTVSTVVNFAPGQVSALISVPILDDLLEEGDEAFNVGLSLPTGGATIGGSLSNALVTIIDDETISGAAGSSDTEFAAVPGADGAINALALQPDGGLLIGGDFRHVNNAVRTRIARLFPNGLLDTNFNPGQGVSGPVRALGLQDDGRIVIGGFFSSVNNTNRNHIARVNRDGSVDISFNPGAGPDNPVNTVAIQTLSGNRKIVLGGTFAVFNGVNRRGIVRLNDNGTIDGSFNPGTGANGPIHALAVQADDKIIAVGTFSAFNSQPYGGIVRLNLNGSIDTSFATGSGANGEIRAVAVQVDGRILVGGSFTEFNGVVSRGVARLNPDGSVDGSFDPGSGADGIVLAIAVQVDGKVLLGGDFTSFGGVSRGRLTRLNPDGSVDPAINFGSGANNFIAAIVVQPDRRMVVAGGFTQFDGETHNGIVRLHGGALAGAGTLEFTSSSYVVDENAGLATITVRRRGGTAGTVSVGVVSSNLSATAGLDYDAVNTTLVFPPGETRKSLTITIRDDDLVEPDERIGLSLQNLSGGAQPGAQPTATLTIVSDDSFVQFASDTFRVTEGFFAGFATITVVRTGTVSGAVTVNYSTAPGTATTNRDYVPVAGRLVFAPGETVKTFQVPLIDDTVVEQDETVFLSLSGVTGKAELGTPANAVLTIAEDDFFPGDLRFSAGAYSVAENSPEVTITVLRSNGLTGLISVRYFTSDDTARFGADYANSSGIITFAEGQASQTFTVPILNDGIVEGNETFFVGLTNASGGSAIVGVARVPVTIIDDDTAAGSVARDFDPGTGANGMVRTLDLQADGKVLIGGAFSSFNNTNRARVARLNANGSLDLAFNPGGGPNGLVSSLGIAVDDQVPIVGSFTAIGAAPFNRVGRLLNSGAADMNLSQGPGFNATINAVFVHQPGGEMFVAGGFTVPMSAIAKLRANGSVDTSFNPGTGLNGPAYCVLEQPDGNVFVGGSFTTADGAPRSRVCRFFGDGLLDSSFSASLISSGSVFCAALQGDGKMVIGGDFVLSPNTNRVGIARLNTDGSLDSTFAPGLGANGTVFALALQASGKIIAGGTFTSFNGVPRNRFLRLTESGAVDLAFDIGNGANGSVYGVKVQPDGNVLIAGEFTAVNGVSRNGVARITADDTALQLTAAVVPPGQTVQLTIAGRAGQTYYIEASSNLTSWVRIRTNNATANTFNVFDPNASQYSHRFYRVRQASP